MESEKLICSKGCGRSYSTIYVRAKHESDCDGRPFESRSCVCEICKRRFPNSMEKSRHKKKGCKIPTIMNRFFDTEISKVKQDIWNNPAPIQIAGLENNIYYAIISVMHFTGDESNRNIIKIEDHGTNATIISEGKPLLISKKVALDMIYERTKNILNSAEIKYIFPAPTGTSKERRSHAMKSFVRSIRNKGKYENTIRLPEYSPKYVDNNILLIMFKIGVSHMGLEDSLDDKLDCLKDVRDTISKGIGFSDGHWFVGAGKINGEDENDELQDKGITPNQNNWQVVMGDPKNGVFSREIVNFYIMEMLTYLSRSSETSDPHVLEKLRTLQIHEWKKALTQRITFSFFKD